MARSQQSFNKREREKNKFKKQQEKLKRREERKANSPSGGLDSMIAYVDENGNITDTPPDPSQKTEVDPESIELGIPKKEDVEVDPVHKGRLDYFNSSKGYGFIADAETREKYFVHISNLQEEIDEGEKVTFELERGPRGMNAIRVRKEGKKIEE